MDLTRSDDIPNNSSTINKKVFLGLCVALFCARNFVVWPSVLKPNGHIASKQTPLDDSPTFEKAQLGANTTLLLHDDQSKLLIQTLEEQVVHLEGDKGKLQEQIEQLKKDNAKMRNGDNLLEEEMNDPEKLRKKMGKLRDEREEIRREIRELEKTPIKAIDRQKVKHLSLQAKSISQEIDRTMKMMTKDRVFAHFLSHVPKSGASYAFNIINALLFATNEWISLPMEDKFTACNVGLHPIEKFFEYTVNLRGGAKCNMWMSERGYTPLPQHIYTIVREPKAHVLSQYFHCKESKDHRNRAHLMPSLDDWLDAYVGAIGNKSQVQYYTNKFRCYNPIDFQSHFLAFNPAKGKEELKKRYDVIGINAQMQKSICVIVTRYSGWVPKECDCTHLSSIETKTATASTLNKRRLFKLADSNITSIEGNRTTALPRISLPGAIELHYNPSKDSHNVTHHGATFSTTKRQDEAIAKLTEVDTLLYQISLDIFEEQAREVEEEYQIKLCDKLRIREGRTYFKVPTKLGAQIQTVDDGTK